MTSRHGSARHQEAQARVKGLIDAVSRRRQARRRWPRFQAAGLRERYFVGGCLSTTVTPEMDIYKTEIFGPVLPSSAPRTTRSHRAAMKHEYGNGVAIFTRDGDAAQRFRRPHHISA